eukprot:CAMPEP_0173221198 /NCGR_PEP_ID=MMETSP1142-20121109/2588_1 /TAXON_ID=483371 /ORGANISM="non described non described, Strain CCMP2298" /LENGTH=151 /DNA_ID=CAMNT_0014149203 /DNA_START=157 /DNA_END=614 /DNA_ORIENTATION=+
MASKRTVPASASPAPSYRKLTCAGRTPQPSPASKIQRKFPAGPNGLPKVLDEVGGGGLFEKNLLVVGVFEGQRDGEGGFWAHRPGVGCEQVLGQSQKGRPDKHLLLLAQVVVVRNVHEAFVVRVGAAGQLPQERGDVCGGQKQRRHHVHGV